MKPSLGHELITVYAREAEFAAGVLYRGKNMAAVTVDNFAVTVDSFAVTALRLLRPT